MSSYFSTHHFTPHWNYHRHHNKGKGQQQEGIHDDDKVVRAAAMAADQQQEQPSEHRFVGLDALAHFLQNFSWHYQRDTGEGHNTIHPHFDLVETAAGYTLYGELPGIDREGVTVEVDDTHYTVAVTGILSRPDPLRKGPAPAGGGDTSAAAPVATGLDIGVVHTKPHQETAAKVEKDQVQDQATATTAAGVEGNPTAEKETREENKESEVETHWHVLERKVGKFHRIFMFPPGLADLSAVDASMINGLITVVVPKKKDMQGKREVPKRKVPVSRGWVNPYGGMLISP